MPDAPDALPDLSPAARGRSQNLLLAGSQGYAHFLHHLAGFISPEEAATTNRTFAATARVFWLSAVAFVLLYFGLNWAIGPRSLAAAATVNDLLRALLFFWAIFLRRRGRVAVAAQLLLPLAMLCFLPMHPTPEPDETAAPAVDALLIFSLLLIGWMIDVGCKSVQDAFVPVRRALLMIAPLLLILLALAGWLWITNGGAFPLFTLIAALAAIPFLLFAAPAPMASSDVEFLYGAAWRRWRFHITGRLLAVLLGAVPFILFTSLLDYQEQVEEAANVQHAPEILRIPYGHEPWHVFYWRQQGRFMTTEDLAAAEPDSPAPYAIYLTTPTTAFDDPTLPAQYRGDEFAVHLPPNVDSAELQRRMIALNGTPISRDDFEDTLTEFAPYRIDSLGRLLRRVDLAGEHDFVSLTFHPLAGDQGILLAERLNVHWLNPRDLERIVLTHSHSKWVFFAIGILGFVFLWRRGGDSSAARWIGIALIGATVIPVLDSSDDTYAYPLHWLWQQSFLYHWNTFSSAAGPLFVLLFTAAGILGLGAVAQTWFTYAWVLLCWPTRLNPAHSPLLRAVIVIAKTWGLVALVSSLLAILVLVFSVFNWQRNAMDMLTFNIGWLLVFVPVGFFLRRYTRKSSEIPHLGPLPLLAFFCLNAALLCYMPTIPAGDELEAVPALLLYVGTGFGILFLLLMLYLILNRDFLRLRAIPSFTALILLLAVPFAIHSAEDFIPPYLTSGPFFREKGAEMVSIMLVVLVFPFLHEYLHEALLLLSVPLLRRIEHRVEHALEHIVDAESEAARAQLISELLDEIHVSRYLFLSRGPHGRFSVDINTLPAPAPDSPAAAPLPLRALHLSSPLRAFLGQRRHFIDLHTLAFEWPLFFHQFELYRLAHATNARFLLPISVGNSLRGLLLLADGPPEAVIGTPALSANINNLALAAALSRPHP